jgi:hypothetical protein
MTMTRAKTKPDSRTIIRKNVNGKSKIPSKLIDKPVDVVQSFLNKLAIENRMNDKLLFNSLQKKKNTAIKTIEHLNSICTDSGECLIIGRENNYIKRLFSGFSDFKYLTNVVRVGESSLNGFVLNLQYEKMKYKVNALLKSSKSTFSDNLYYEYLAGISFINTVNRFVPCFTETYRLFKHRSASTKADIENGVELSQIQDLIDENTCDEKNVKTALKCINEACEIGEDFAILLQYVNNPISLKSFIKNNENNELFEGQMIAILFQIYSPLEYFRNQFTHYDLHTENVILYKLPKEKYINLKYIERRSGKPSITHEIKSYYIAKIIDYGRCFFGNLENDKNLNSEKIGKIIFKTRKCTTTKGEIYNDVGLNFFELPTSDSYHISSLRRNFSHDLRLAYMVSKTSVTMQKLFGNRIIYEQEYGTKELESDQTQNINNLEDMIKFLEIACKNTNNHSVDENHKSIGTLEIYKTNTFCKEPMKFVPLKNVKYLQ